jgi:hypothetical protein
MVISGSVLAGQYGMDYEVDVRVASRELTERERQQLTVYLHKGLPVSLTWARFWIGILTTT